VRVLVVVHGFPPRAVGGTEIYARAHALTLHAQFGDDIFVLTREQDASRPEYSVRQEDRDGLHVAWINNTFRDAASFEQTYRNEAIDAAATPLIDNFQPDVAHIHHLTCLSTNLVAILKARGIPCVLTLHDYWLKCHRGQLLDLDYRVCHGPHHGCRNCIGAAAGGAALHAGAALLRTMTRGVPETTARLIHRAAAGVAGVLVSEPALDQQQRLRLEHMRAVCRDITHFVAPSRSIRDRFVAFGVPEGRITVADNGTDTSGLVVTPRRARGPLRAAFVGTLMVSKAPHLLVEAIRLLTPGTAEATLIGAYSPYHGDDRYRTQLDALSNHPSVRMLGPIEHSHLPEALNGVDVVVVPSIWPENSPVIIHEAFAAGIPVVGSRIGGIPELIDDGRNGLLFEPGDANGLARALTRLIEDPGLIDHLRRGIKPVRTLAEDAAAARQIYAQAIAPANGRRLAAVVLNYQTPDQTLLAVRSLMASRRTFDSIIVVDNSQDDGLRDAVRGMPQARYLRTGRNLGFSGGVNAGIREALSRDASHVLLVNSDMIVPPDCVERLIDALESSRAGIAGPIVLARADPGRVFSRGMMFNPRTGRMRHLGAGDRHGASDVAGTRTVDAVSGCLMLVRREVFDAAGTFDERYFYSFEDLELCLRAARHQWRTVLAGNAVAYHESGRSIGAASPQRLYFAARNHLLLASATPGGRLAAFWRGCSVVALNVAHAVTAPGGPLPRRLAAVARGTSDFFRHRFGGPSES
jgi:GT2 family glycosyltransferase/glycosyltransferase involved in cell wall biosynthesis